MVKFLLLIMNLQFTPCSNNMGKFLQFLKVDRQVSAACHEHLVHFLSTLGKFLPTPPTHFPNKTQ